MNRNNWTIICLAYVIGLLSTYIFGFPNPNPSWQQWTFVLTGLGFFSAIAALFIPKLWRIGPGWKLWLSAGIIAILAVIYFQFRVPEPSNTDISQLLVKNNVKSLLVQIDGKVLNEPRLTRSGKIRLWLKPIAVDRVKSKKINNFNKQVTGKLYVTLPLLEDKQFYPGTKLSLEGILYLPKQAVNPGGFDFKTYLNSQGSFAGLTAKKVNIIDSSQKVPWGLWKVRKRIIKSQGRWLESPTGKLISSIVLGRRAVDLPYDIRDLFIKAGLAHILAASGFHVSLLLGTVLIITNRFTPKAQFLIGITVLFVYVGLTGIQPSVMRASLMGVAVLIGNLSERKVTPLGSLLLAGTLLLIFNPLWIWDLGFNLSFLATLGLIVTMPVLQKKLDWLPPTLASIIAIPIAASLWTLPLTSYVFNTVALYSIPINIIADPLILFISLGGMISALIGLVIPIAGSAIAWLLYYPTQFLIEIIQFFNGLPGSSLIVGKINLGILIIIYGLIILVWLNKFWQKRSHLAILFALILIVIPIFYERSQLVQITILAAKQAQIIVVQNQGKVILINSGDRNTVRYVILPFLLEQGIDRIDCGIALDSDSDLDLNNGWSEITKNIAIASFLINSNWSETFENNPNLIPNQLVLNKTLSIGNTKIELLGKERSLLELEILNRKWLIMEGNQKIELKKIAKKPEFLLWSSRSISEKLLLTIAPETAIASSSWVTKKTQEQIEKKQIKLYWTGRDGAIQWRPDLGLTTTLKRKNQERI